MSVFLEKLVGHRGKSIIFYIILCFSRTSRGSGGRGREGDAEPAISQKKAITVVADMAHNIANKTTETPSIPNG